MHTLTPSGRLHILISDELGKMKQEPGMKIKKTSQSKKFLS